ncbi:hypothetical protein [Halobellus sp. EA9]|uniref:hypothetical protein n=1 Tax=Halobellus sp. EA9 TaxID=3421647 RepID=UPI003EBD3FF4
MAPLPHLSAKLAVGIGSAALALLGAWATMATAGYPREHTLRSWPAVLARRLRRELPRGDHLTVAWAVVAAWSVLVSGLHFGGLYYDIYNAYPWWDLLTHAMGGLGVAALLSVTFREETLRSPFWVVAAVLAIGAGFEVYEFVFKTFWYRWSLGYYVTDTVVDLLINTSGAVVFAAAVALYQRRNGAAARTASGARSD